MRIGDGIQPGLEEVLAAPAAEAVPVYRAVPADTETPISAFLKLRRGGTAFLLESAEQDGSLGRYSFIGVLPDAILRADLERGTLETEQGLAAYEGGPLDAVRRLVGDAPVHRTDSELPGLVGGAVGAFGYDLVRALERLPARARDDTAFPAALFARYRTIVILDHLRQRIVAVSTIPPGADRRAGYGQARARVEQALEQLRRSPALPSLRPAGEPADGVALLARAERVPADDEFLAAVGAARELVRGGDAIQVVLSRRLALPFAGDPFRLYRALRMLNPSPYMFYLEFPELALVGASPEMLLRAEGGVAQLCPIAGTRPRGAGADEDARNEAELLADPKERAEHVMLVDLGRNDLGRVCEPGTVHVPRYLQVERYSHVMHLVSMVTGRLAPGVDALDAFAACFPAGTVSGAPKVRAMEIIDELEPVRRGAYAGAVGYVGLGGRSLDTCIAIRTVVVRGGRALVQAGAGVVADSEPRRELEETSAKAAALLAALAVAGPDENGRAAASAAGPEAAGRSGARRGAEVVG